MKEIEMENENSNEIFDNYETSIMASKKFGNFAINASKFGNFMLVFSVAAYLSDSEFILPLGVGLGSFGLSIISYFVSRDCFEIAQIHLNYSKDDAQKIFDEYYPTTEQLKERHKQERELLKEQKQLEKQERKR